MIVAITIIAAIVVVFVFVFVFLLSFIFFVNAFLPSFDYKDGDEFHVWIPWLDSRSGIQLQVFIIG
jgi:hypothetical protein